MPDDKISKSEITGDLHFDKRLMLFLNTIRCDANYAHWHSPDTGSVSCLTDTLKVVADATMELATRERLLAEKDRFKAETEKIKAETERITAETERIKAEKM